MAVAVRKAELTPLEGCVISHTHWDREWYKPFQEFRFFLVRVIDDILDMMNNNPEYRYFHMDGQTVVLEDYAEIRPERVDELRARIREGRILVGPWYDAPDLFLVDGESLVRNLQLGCRVSREWGGEPLSLGYGVDFFGHSSQMPQIYAGFGITAATQFRGTNRHEVAGQFIWEGSDGSECLVYRLCDDKAYSNFWYTFRPILTQRQPYDAARVKEGLAQLIDEFMADSRVPYMLFMDGVDHATANPATTRIITDANRFYDDIEFVHTSWPEYRRKVEAYLAEKKPELDRVKGELRSTNKDGKLNRVTVDCSSSRIYLKIANKQCETELIRWFEPLRALGAKMGVAQPRGFLELAWRYLLKNHPHDSICGCSIDQVHRDMEYRFDQARMIAGEAVRDLMVGIEARIDTSFLGADDRGVLVFNPSQYPRAGTARLKITLPGDEPATDFALVDSVGNEIPHQLLDYRRVEGRVAYTPIRCASGCSVTEIELAADLGAVPPMGYSTFAVTPRRRKGLGKKRVAETCGVMENPFLRVTLDDQGRLTVTDKESQQTYRGLHSFEDCGETGDLWNHASPAVDLVVIGVKSAKVSLVANGPLLATHRVEYVLELPDGVADNGARRSETFAPLKVTSYFTLTHTGRRIDVRTEIHNTVPNHRLRVTFPSDVKTNISYASSQFDVVQRSISVRDLPDYLEPETEIKPTQGFVDVSGENRALAIITRGLPEYAVLDDARRTVAVTLLRALSSTVGTQGEPDAQCMRDITFNYAIYPHTGRWDEAGVPAQVDAHNLDLRTVEATAHAGEYPPTLSFVAVEPANLILSSLRNPYDSEQDIVIRVYNPTEQTVSGVIELKTPFSKVFECDLEDRPKHEVEAGGRGVKLAVAPRKIKTLRFSE